MWRWGFAWKQQAPRIFSVFIFNPVGALHLCCQICDLNDCSIISYFNKNDGRGRFNLLMEAWCWLEGQTRQKQHELERCQDALVQGWAIQMMMRPTFNYSHVMPPSTETLVKTSCEKIHRTSLFVLLRPLLSALFSKLAHMILPDDENFLLVFRRENPLDNTVEFMKVKSHSTKNNSRDEKMAWHQRHPPAILTVVNDKNSNFSIKNTHFIPSSFP